MINSRTWVEISKENVQHNIRTLKGRVKEGTLFCPAVKANAYGHGIKEISPLIIDAGADWLGVDNLAEAVTLRENGITAPIYIMGYIPLEELEIAVREGFHFVVYNQETLEKLTEVTRRLQMPAYTHLKLETGTNRQGVMPEDLSKIISYYKEEILIVLEGVATHFANIEDTCDHTYAANQTEQFLCMTSRIRDEGLNPKYQHCANSAATILFPNTHGNFVRPGIATYGLWPSKETYVSYKGMQKSEGESEIELKPVLSWKTKVASVKKVPENSAIGYGCTYSTNKDSMIAVLPVGYSDGIRRNQSGKGNVLIRGKRAPILGRIMMNMMVVDVTDIPGVQLEDEVVIIGEQLKPNGSHGYGGDLQFERISAEQVADNQGTINYEVTTQINPLIERRVV